MRLPLAIRDHDHFLKVRPTMTRTRPIDLIEAPLNLGLKPPKAATEPGTRSQVIAANEAPSVLLSAPLTHLLRLPGRRSNPCELTERVSLENDRAQQMIGWDPIFEAEIPKHCDRLHPTAHHRTLTPLLTPQAAKSLEIETILHQSRRAPSLFQ